MPAARFGRVRTTASQPAQTPPENKWGSRLHDAGNCWIRDRARVGVRRLYARRGAPGRDAAAGGIAHHRWRGDWRLRRWQLTQDAQGDGRRPAVVPEGVQVHQDFVHGTDEPFVRDSWEGAQGRTNVDRT